MLTCSFSGHRVLPVTEVPALQTLLENLILQLSENGVHTYISGGAEGFDLLAAETVLALKPDLPQLKLKLFLPFPGHESVFSVQDQARFRAIVERADEVRYLSGHYHKSCFALRDHAMIDASQLCAYYMTDLQSGTGLTVRYAVQQGLTTMNLAEQL